MYLNLVWFVHDADRYLLIKNVYELILSKKICLNVSLLSRAYEARKQTAVDVKVEVEKQLAAEQRLEIVMPLVIVIGPFLVNVEPLRRRLMSKRADMGKAMLELLARQLRKQADEVSLIYNEEKVEW